jgi:hypothetical protein
MPVNSSAWLKTYTLQVLLRKRLEHLHCSSQPRNLKCRRWVHQVQKKENPDLEAGLFPPAPRDISKYKYWGPRLLELKEEFDESEPTTLKQWILDTRRPNQRYTFLIAVAALALALTFGLIQSITGVIQAAVSVRKGD